MVTKILKLSQRLTVTNIIEAKMSTSDIGYKHDVDVRLIMLVTFSVQDA